MRYITFITDRDKLATGELIHYWILPSKEYQENAHTLIGILLKAQKEAQKEAEEIKASLDKKSKRIKGNTYFYRAVDPYLFLDPTDPAYKEQTTEYNLLISLCVDIPLYLEGNKKLTKWEQDKIKSYSEGIDLDFELPFLYESLNRGYNLTRTNIPEENYFDTVKSLVILPPFDSRDYSWDMI